jgi:hypothetical protein
MKYLLIIFLLVFSACGKVTQNEIINPTVVAETDTAPVPTTNTGINDFMGPEKYTPMGNFLISLDEQNFILSLEYVFNELLIRDSELGNVLLGCDIATTYSPTAEDVKIIANSQNGISNCAITLIREEDYSSSDSIWAEYNPVQESGRSLVAAVIPIGDSNFPLMVIPEGNYDAEYFIRVIGHETFHMSRFLNGENCPAMAEKSCKINEEVLAFKRQFELLEYYLVSTDQVESYKERGLTFLPETSDLNKTAIKHEYALYFLNKDNLLYEYLYDQNYGEGYN